MHPFALIDLGRTLDVLEIGEKGVARHRAEQPAERDAVNHRADHPASIGSAVRGNITTRKAHTNKVKSVHTRGR